MFPHLWFRTMNDEGMSISPPPRGRRALLIGLGALAAAIVGVVLWYAPKYDNPAPERHEPIKSDINYHGLQGTLRLQCQCPLYLTQGKQRSLAFQVEIELKGGPMPRPAGDPEQIWLRSDAHSAGIDDDLTFIADRTEFYSAGKVTKNFELGLQPKDQDLSQINFHLALSPPGGADFTGTLAALAWPIRSRAPFLSSLAPLAYAVLVFVLVVGSFYLADRKLREFDQREREELERAKLRAQNNPGQASPAWEAASTNLQAYFKRNLLQVKWVFGVAVGVMLAGFFVVLWGVNLSFQDPNHLTPTSKIATLSGLITQFIGATFMVIFRSTMSQANDFVNVLDRINTVNIAMKVLDSIPEGEASIKNATRQQLVTLLLGSRQALRLATARNSDNKLSKDKRGRGSQSAPDEG
jgi:hypothetical protein